MYPQICVSIISFNIFTCLQISQILLYNYRNIILMGLGDKKKNKFSNKDSTLCSKNFVSFDYDIMNTIYTRAQCCAYIT